MTSKTEIELLSSRIMDRSPFFQECLAEREEILRHKWLVSERVGYDLGYDWAVIDWVVHHRKAWLNHYRLQGSLAS